MNRPTWYGDDKDTSWNNVKDAFRKDWEQTKHDFGSKTARDLDQDAGDTVREATTGVRSDFEKHEASFRFGHAARQHYGDKHPAWSNDLETDLRQDYGTDYDRDRDYIRHAYEYDRTKA
ncbi:MAG: hypothetical protein JOZ54_06015 [Acidobacteria bacterium]|nr:hypothetical protein [Acidobacteriota bacterium]